MTFHFTHRDSGFDSSLVAEAYYNANTRKLAVVLGDGWGYVYSGVPQNVYDSLIGGPSAGSTYNRVVKREYGPGEHLGYVGFDNEEEFVAHYPAPSMEPVERQGVGTPKNLTYAAGAKVTTLGVPGGTFSLGTDGHAHFSAAPVRQHSVVFEGNGKTRVHKVRAASVDEAVKAVHEIGEALDLEFKVKEVVVSFE